MNENVFQENCISSTCDGHIIPYSNGSVIASEEANSTLILQFCKRKEYITQEEKDDIEENDRHAKL